MMNNVDELRRECSELKQNIVDLQDINRVLVEDLEREVVRLGHVLCDLSDLSKRAVDSLK